MNSSRLRVALVGIETTHTLRWLEALTPQGAEILFCPLDDVCAEHGKRLSTQWPLTRTGSVEDAVEWAEIAAILTCDWDNHVSLAAPFIERGTTVYVDKPAACAESDLQQLLAWSSKKIVLGSSNRYDAELRKWRHSPDIRSVMSTVGQPDPFGYGIHAVEMGQTVLGVGAQRVRSLTTGSPFLFEVEHRSGAQWIVGTQKPAPTFEVSIETDTEAHALTVAGGKWHQSLVAEVLRVHGGAAPLYGVDEMVEASRILCAAHTSAQSGNSWIPLEKSTATFSGKAYRKAYLEKRFPVPSL